MLAAGEQGGALPLGLETALRRPPASKSIPIPSSSAARSDEQTERDGKDDDEQPEVVSEDSTSSVSPGEEDEDEVKVEEKNLKATTTPGEERKLLLTQSCPETASKSAWFDDDEQEDCCCICLEAFDENNPAKLTKCGHEYHLQCIMQWYQRNSCCPMCGTDVELVEEDAQSLLACVERRLSRSPPESSGAAGSGNESSRRLGLMAAHHRSGLRGDIPYPANGERRRTFSVTFPTREASSSSAAATTSGTSRARSGSGSLSLANFRKTTSGFFRKLRNRSSSSNQ